MSNHSAREVVAIDFGIHQTEIDFDQSVQHSQPYKLLWHLPFDPCTQVLRASAYSIKNVYRIKCLFETF